MKRILITLAAVLLTASTLSAQSLAEATKIAKTASEALSAADYAAAVDGFKSALSIADKCGDAGVKLSEVCKGIIPKAMNALAKQMLQKKDWDGALVKLREASLLAGEYGQEDAAAEAAKLISRAYMAKGTDLFEAEDFAAAAEVYKDALEADASNGLAALRYGMALEGEGKAEEALAAYQCAASNGQSDNANIQMGKYFLARAMEKLGAKNYSEALDNALKSNNYVENAQALQIAGQASQLMGKSADAVKYYEQYLAAAPKAANASEVSAAIEALKKL